ncbi:putative zinc finger CCCH domain protein, partial [Trifolium pratense]
MDHHQHFLHHQDHRTRFAPPHLLPQPLPHPPPPPISYRTTTLPQPPPYNNPPLPHQSSQFPIYHPDHHPPRRFIIEPPWNPNPEDRSSRIDYHRESHHHQHQNHRPQPSYPPPIRYEHERLNTEGNPRESFLYRQHVTAAASASTSNLAYHESDDRIDNRRWLNDRKLHNSSPPHSPSFELVNDGITARDYHSSETVRFNGGSNSSRSNSRECNHNHGREFSRTPPKKQIQKKSALLRIQTVKPNRRNRDVEQRYVPDSKVNFFKGNSKDQRGGYTKGGGEDRKKENPVEEFDVSCESSVLVAKPRIVTSGAVSGKLSSVVRTAKEGDASEKNVGDACDPHEKNGGEVSVEASGTSILKLASKIVKKKKTIKRMVKKGSVKCTNPGVSASPSLANEVGGIVEENSVARSSSNAASGTVETETCLEEKINGVDKVAAPEDEGDVLDEDIKVGLSLLSSKPESRSQEGKNSEDSDIGKEPRFEKGGSISDTPSCVSSILGKSSCSDCLDVCNSVHDLLSMTNIDKATKSLNGSTSEINHLDCGNKTLCQSEVSLSPAENIDVGCSGNRNLVDVGNQMNYNAISADIVSTQNSADDSVYGFNSNDLTSSEEKTTVNDSGNNDIDGEAYCEKIAPLINQYSTSEENSDTAIPLSSSRMVAFSSLGDTRIQDGQDSLQHISVLKQGSDDGLSSLEEGIIVHQFDIIKDAEKQVSPGEVPLSAENCDIDKTFPNSNISLGFDVRDTSKIEKRDVKTRLNFLSLNLDDISLPPVNHSNDTDRGSTILLKDPCASEVLDDSIQSLDFYSLSNQVGDTALHGKRAFSEAEFCVANNDNDDENVSKRKKVTSSDPNLTQFQTEFSASIVATASTAEVPISFSDRQEHKKDDIALSSMGMDIQSKAQSMPYSGDIAKSSDCSFTGGSFESTDVNRETKSSEHLELQVSTQCEDLAIPNVQFSEQKDNVTPIVVISNTQTDILVIGNIMGEKTDSQVAENNCHYGDVVQRSPTADMLSNDLNMKGDLLSQENRMSCPAVGISNSNNELPDGLPDALSDMYSQGMTSELPDRMITEATAMDIDENIPGNEENIDFVSMVKHGSDSDTSSKQHTEKTTKSDHAIECSNQISRNIIPEPTQVFSKVTPFGLNSSCFGLNGSKNQPGGVILKASKGPSFPFPKSKSKTPASSVRASKSRTWRRTDNNPPASLPRVNLSAEIVPSKRPILQRKNNFQNTSYIRKGNSLVRNPSPVSAIPQILSTSSVRPTPVSAIPQISFINPLPLGLGEIHKGTKPESRADLTDQPIYSKTKVSNTSLPIDIKSGENISSPLLEPPSSGFCENVSGPRKFIETNDASASSEGVLKQYETPENQTGPSSNGECQGEANDGNISSLNSKRIVYIKPKTNQLVATSSSCDTIVSTDDKGQTAISDSYYKRKKNQLVRSTFENHVNQTFAMPNNIVNSDGQGDSKVLCKRRSTKRRSHKAIHSGLRRRVAAPKSLDPVEIIVGVDELVKAVEMKEVGNGALPSNRVAVGMGVNHGGCSIKLLGLMRSVAFSIGSAGISRKSSRASLVWTLGSKNSSGNDRNFWHYQKVLPHLVPWKRTTYLRSFINNSASSFNSGSLSPVGKKLLQLRKRDTVYTRSTRGFSLWKSKVLGVGGSSLKWSKSIEKHSKKANEEATLAVAAVERKKREKKDPACIGPQTK